MSSFETIHRRAKMLEARLESRVQSYSSLAQKFNADLGYGQNDEENSLLDSGEEQALASEIESDLAELQDCIQNMRKISRELGEDLDDEELQVCLASASLLQFNDLFCDAQP